MKENIKEIEKELKYFINLKEYYEHLNQSSQVRIKELEQVLFDGSSRLSEAYDKIKELEEQLLRSESLLKIISKLIVYM